MGLRRAKAAVQAGAPAIEGSAVRVPACSGIVCRPTAFLGGCRATLQEDQHGGGGCRRETPDRFQGFATREQALAFFGARALGGGGAFTRTHRNLGNCTQRSRARSLEEMSEQCAKPCTGRHARARAPPPRQDRRAPGKSAHSRPRERGRESAMLAGRSARSASCRGSSTDR